MRNGVAWTLACLLMLGAPADAAESTTGETLPEVPKEILMDLMKEAGLTSVEVSDITRSARSQADILYKLLQNPGPAAVKAQYGSVTDALVDYYVANRSSMNQAQMIAALEGRIAQYVAQNPNRTQLMHIEPTSNHTFDVAPSSLGNAAPRFVAALTSHPDIVRFFQPGAAEKAFHIEIAKTKRAIAGTYSGSCRQGGDAPSARITLQRDAGGYGGSLEAAGERHAFTSVSVNRKSRQVSLQFQGGGDTITLTGAIDADYRTLTLSGQGGISCNVGK